MKKRMKMIKSKIQIIQIKIILCKIKLKKINKAMFFQIKN